MPTEKKARRAMTAVRMWKVTETKIAELAKNGELTAPSTVEDYLDILKDEALEEMAAK